MRSVDLPEDAEIPEAALERLRALPAINIYRLLGIVPQSVIPWTDLTAALYQCDLDPRLREIAICRQAHAANAGYELHQHRFIAQNNGVTDAELDAVLFESPVRSLDPEANLVCKVADELEGRAGLSDQTFDELYVRSTPRDGAGVHPELLRGRGKAVQRHPDTDRDRRSAAEGGESERFVLIGRCVQTQVRWY